MGFAIALRTLLRHRVLLAIGVLVATFVCLLISFQLPNLKSRNYKIGVATASILVDTPRSQVVDVNPLGINSVAATANLLAVVMTQGGVKASIAKNAGLQPSKLSTISASAAGPQTSVPDSVARDPGAGILITNTLTNAAGNQLPVISIEAKAADANAAARLANAASSGLLGYLSSTAAAERIPQQARLRVTSMGAAEAQEETRGPSPILAVFVGFLVFGAFAGAILGFSALARAYRQLDALEQEEGDDGDAPEPAPEHQPASDHPVTRSHGHEEPSQHPPDPIDFPTHLDFEFGGDDAPAAGDEALVGVTPAATADEGAADGAETPDPPRRGKRRLPFTSGH
jgi:hypothetical protein